MSIKIITSQQDDITVVALSGRLTGGEGAFEVHDEVNRLIDDGVSKLVIDLGGVDFMSSAGLGVLISAATTLVGASRHRLRLSSLSSRIFDLIRLTRTYQFAVICKTQADAVASFAGETV